ncbi:MAG TPA: DUF6498-containing protein [Chitinophagaceae bacterium]|nr:DUF6498-containing protein [Chitinophagaceae bacterium]
MLKRILFDPAFLFLIAINAYCIWYYQNNPNEFNTLVFLYWGQSVLIGIFNFADLLTAKDIIPGSISINDIPVNNSARSKGCTASFFAVHYGFFHLAYGIFILISTKLKIDFHFVLIGLAAFSLNLTIQFIKHKQWQRTNAVNLGTMFFLPYLRIIPMHLMILGPVFLHWQASTIFLVLKTVADVVMYIITSPMHKPDIAGNKSL